MTERTIKKVLITQEDLALGQGDVVQTRQGASKTLKAIDLPWILTDSADLRLLDTAKYKHVQLQRNGSTYDYHYSASAAGTDDDWNIIAPAVGTGRWLLTSTGVFYSVQSLQLFTGTVSGQSVYLSAGGRSGHFNWDSSDLSAEVAADTLQGVYIAPASDVTGASGAWVRADYDGSSVEAEWFGALFDCDDITLVGTDDSVAMQAAINFANGVPVLCPGRSTLIGTGLTSFGTSRLIIKGRGNRYTRFNATAAFVGSLFTPEKNYEFYDFFIQGNYNNGMNGIGCNIAGSSAGGAKAWGLYINNCDIGISFGEEFEHPLGVDYRNLYIQNFRTGGINLGGVSGAAASGESAASIYNCVVTNLPNNGRDVIPSSVSSNTPDATHDRITWSADSNCYFGYLIMRSADGSTNWHVPPNWDEAVFTSTTFDAEKQSGESWTYAVVRNTVGINIRRMKAVDFCGASQAEYCGIGFLLNNLVGVSGSSIYYETRNTGGEPRASFAAVYNNNSAAVSLESLWVEQASYAVFNGFNGLTTLDSVRANNCFLAVIGQTGSTGQAVYGRGVRATGTTPEILRSTRNSSNDYNYHLVFCNNETEFSDEISHKTLPVRRLKHRNVLVSEWGYDSTRKAYIETNEQKLERIAKSPTPEHIATSSAIRTALTSGSATSIATFEIGSFSSVAFTIECGIQCADGSSVTRQSGVFKVSAALVSIGGTVTGTLTVHDETVHNTGSHTMALAASFTESAGVVTIKITATTSVTTPALFAIYPKAHDEYINRLNNFAWL